MTTAASTEILPVEHLKAELAEIEEKVVTGYTLADAIREGASVTGKKSGGWIDRSNACSLGAGWIAARARGYV